MTPASPPATLGMASGYRPRPGAFDEMVGPDGRIRGHWVHLGAVLDRLGPRELASRRAEVAAILEEEGVSYNVYGPAGRRRQWDLDPVPVVLTSSEWAEIETGVVQRAELLNLVLADLYSRRDLLRRGVLPPEVVYAHPGFLRECDGVGVKGDRQLLTLAVDVARDPTGRHLALADHTQAPSGAAYALANRTALSRVLPSLYRDAQVHRLAPFFRALRSGLQAVAPTPQGEPRIVVLSPGARSATAFEHGFLAAQLGYQLVEGTDLKVSGGRVWMRSLRRPEPVDVILRRVDAAYADPLELRPDSFLGVPGLLEACRRQTVAVVNTLGSGVLENPGLMPFLPRLAEHLLGEPLLLESAPTWWCGDPAGLSHVLSHLDELTLCEIGAGPAGHVHGRDLPTTALEELRRRVAARPHSWVGQEWVHASTVPVLGGAGAGAGELEARPFALRTYAVVGGGSYVVMPGGLAIVGSDSRVPLLNQESTVSKDTWVLASEPEGSYGYWQSAGPVVAAADPGSLVSSRVAENLVWLGRYAERAEAAARLLRVVHDRRNDFADGHDRAGALCVEALLSALTRVTATEPGFTGPDGAGLLREPGPELGSLAADTDRPGSLAFSLSRMLDAAEVARDQLSLDTWLVIGSLQREVVLQGEVLQGEAAGRHTLGRVMTSLLALEGLGAECMVREPGWWLMDAGRRIERGINLATFLRATVTTERDRAADSLLMESVLTVSESIITYRRRYRSKAQLETLLDLLLLDPDNPRSLAFQLDRLLEDLRSLPEPPGGARVSDAEKPAIEAWTALRLADTSRLATTDPEGRRQDLDLFLLRLVDHLERSALGLAASYFSHALALRAFSTPADPGRPRATFDLVS